MATGRFWQIAVLTAAGAIAFAPDAEATLYYWQDYEPGFYRRGPTPQPRRQQTRRHSTAKAKAAEKDTGAKPQGPLIIAISIEKQKLRVYDANGFFAESPVSTGMRGHSTPMGIFSIIQKRKLHHSNIYSGAPMPYMQRITWSGVALHAGVLPGYPASHGCIRMPMAFAQKMWNWTRMGARVVVTPGEMTPASFSHPLLVTQKVVPVADEAPQVDAPLGMKSDKGAEARPAAKPVDSADANLELRSTVGHGPLTQTADASGAMPANAGVTMSDASPAGAPDEAVSIKTTEISDTETRPEAAKSGEAKSETAKSEAGPESADAAASEDKSADARSTDIVTGGVKSAETSAVDNSAAKAAASANAEKDTADATTEAKTEAEPGATAGIATTEAPTAETVKPDEPKASEKPVEPAKSVADAPASAPDVRMDNVKKDPARLPVVEKAEAKTEPKRAGRIAVFISRKDGKLYVRENFKPQFDVPVTIAPSDRPLGTHVFTAQVDKDDANVLRWSVVSLPVSARNTQKNDDYERSARRRKIAAAAPVEMKPVSAPNSPAEALDRITIPPDAMARIAEALTAGGSIVVSDQGINQGGETGEGTDFVVLLR